MCGYGLCFCLLSLASANNSNDCMLREFLGCCFCASVSAAVGVWRHFGLGVFPAFRKLRVGFWYHRRKLRGHIIAPFHVAASAPKGIAVSSRPRQAPPAARHNRIKTSCNRALSSKNTDGACVVCGSVEYPFSGVLGTGVLGVLGTAPEIFQTTTSARKRPEENSRPRPGRARVSPQHYI